MTDSPRPDWLTDERKQRIEEGAKIAVELWEWEKSRYVEALQAKCGLSRTEALLLMVWNELSYMTIGMSEGKSLQERGLKILEKVEEEMDEHEEWRGDTEGE